MIKGIVRRPLLIAEAIARQWPLYNSQHNRDKTGRTGQDNTHRHKPEDKLKINQLGKCREAIQSRRLKSTF